MRVGSCPVDDTTYPVPEAVIEQNHECHGPITSSEVGDLGSRSWVSRVCHGNHYGRYVYILKAADDDPQLSLCEVEVWGQESEYYYNHDD